MGCSRRSKGGASVSDEAEIDGALMATPASRRAVIAGGLMAAGAAGAYLAVPQTQGNVKPPHLNDTVPQTFSGWTADMSVTPLLPDEALQATIRKIYDETFSRTYRDAQGRGVMLVIAYGSRQTESLQAHQPEVCYAAQGFHIEKRGEQQVMPGIAAERDYATLGNRSEPILYWLCVGGQIVRFGMKMRLYQLKLGLKGIVPEGFLVRASLIGPDEPGSYELLAKFMAEMLGALPPELRQRIGGV